MAKATVLRDKNQLTVFPRTDDGDKKMRQFYATVEVLKSLRRLAGKLSDGEFLRAPYL
jgi:hypothetical protein